MARPGARFPTLQPGAGTSRMRRNAEDVAKSVAKSVAAFARPPDYK